jgi:hypothetical protein
MSNTITPTVFYRTLNVEGLEIFYREAGPQDAPTVLLLHGFPSSSHMFRNLIPSAELHLLDTGHFALEEEVDRIGSLMHEFLDQTINNNK